MAPALLEEQLDDIHKLGCEQELGLILVDPNGALRELNSRARYLVESYLIPELGAHPDKEASFDDLVGSLVEKTRHGKIGIRFQFSKADTKKVLDVSFVDLDKTCEVLKGLFLIVLKELLLPPFDASRIDLPDGRSLSDRQVQVLNLLVNSSMPRKHIAKQLRIREGTLRKHIEQIYRKLKVNSRVELVSSIVSPKKPS